MSFTSYDRIIEATDRIERFVEKIPDWRFPGGCGRGVYQARFWSINAGRGRDLS